ncbi:hypothetical protein [Oxobacter pfennigii]|nr:hypothetical protein [Oxobacter pfennigii]
MENHFKNILTRNKKKNGFTLFLITILLTLLPGTLIACSSNTNEKGKTEPNSSILPAQADNQGGTQTTDVNKPDEALSADAQEIKSIAEKFSFAFFNGDTDLMKSYLTKPFEWDIEVFDGSAKEVTGITIKGLADIQEKNIGDTSVVSVEYRGAPQDDSFQYLTIELIKQPDGWKIRFYGVER